MTGAAASAPTTTPEPTERVRDGVSGLVTLDRPLWTRELSLPTPEDDGLAEAVLAELLARAEGRRPRR